MRPSEALRLHRDEVLAILARYPVKNPRIFGSVARGEDVEGSDLDLLVEPVGPVSYFALGSLASELEGALGCKVDLGEVDSLRPGAAGRIASEALAL